MNQEKTIVYLGPTLSAADAKQWLPYANYHGPIQCNDILKALRLSPKRLVIIDGLYEQVPAVWHKEILFALEKGVEVYGAASMGALRASELHHFGMIGVGKIFEDFKNGILEDDDEVAVLHGDESLHYRAMNDAMVDVRATLAAATAENIINEDDKKALIRSIKTEFYPNRSLIKTCEKDPQHFSELIDWLQEGNFINQKRNDAITLLQKLSKNTLKATIQKNPEVPRTNFFITQLDIANQHAFEKDLPWLPSDEKALLALCENDILFPFLKDLTLLTNIAYSFSEQTTEGIPETALKTFISSEKLYNPESAFSDFNKTPEAQSIKRWALERICLNKINSPLIEHYETLLGYYFKLPATPEFPMTQQLIQRYALLWLCAQQTRGTDQGKLAKPYFENFLKQFMQNHELSSQKDFENWLQARQLTQEVWVAFLLQLSQYKAFPRRIAATALPQTDKSPQLLSANKIISESAMNKIQYEWHQFSRSQTSSSAATTPVQEG